MFVCLSVCRSLVYKCRNLIKSNQFISETADSKIEIHDNDNVQPLTDVLCVLFLLFSFLFVFLFVYLVYNFHNNK